MIDHTNLYLTLREHPTTLSVIYGRWNRITRDWARNLFKRRMEGGVIPDPSQLILNEPIVTATGVKHIDDDSFRFVRPVTGKNKMGTVSCAPCGSVELETEELKSRMLRMGEGITRERLNDSLVCPKCGGWGATLTVHENLSATFKCPCGYVRKFRAPRKGRRHATPKVQTT